MAITAYSAAGDESAFSTELSFSYDTTDRVIFLEAESGTLTTPMQVFSDAATSWVAASPTHSDAAATLNFDVPYAADYYVWCRVLAPSLTSDAFNVSVDQGPEEIYDIYGTASPPAGMIQTNWTWSRIQISPGIARAYALGSGAHSIRFRCRENSWLDRVVIVCNADFIPTDALPVDNDFVAVVDHPKNGDVAVGGTITLSATFVATGPVSFQWSHDGVAIPNANQTTLTLSNMQESGGGAYSLCAWQSTATASTIPATLSVLSAASSPVFRVRTMSLVGAGGRVTFEVEGALGSQLGVFTSSALVNWNFLKTQAVTGNTLTVTDTGAVGASQRFYRLADNRGP